MKLYWEVIKAIFNKIFLRKNNGEILKILCSNMGLVYIKAAQILSTQSIGTTFTEGDRILISALCDDCEKVSFDIIKQIIEEEYQKPIEEVFEWIDSDHPKAASISQVYEARLKNGERVAIKVKRLDITNHIDKDIATIRKLMNRFGKYIGFKNQISGNKALDMYLDWILQEVDFINEVKNIETYQNFALSVNEKVADTKNIVVPKAYSELSTENIIVMEYIDCPTINHIELTEENKEIIKRALNSYLQSSFYALFHDQEVIFHGDPHGGNIFIDENGNIGF